MSYDNDKCELRVAAIIDRARGVFTKDNEALGIFELTTMPLLYYGLQIREQIEKTLENCSRFSRLPAK